MKPYFILSYNYGSRQTQWSTIEQAPRTCITELVKDALIVNRENTALFPVGRGECMFIHSHSARLIYFKIIDFKSTCVKL